MRNFWLLFKVNIINTFGLNQLKKRFAHNSFFLRIIMPLITILLGLGLMAIIIFYMQGFAIIFIAAENPTGLLKYGIAIGILFCFLTTISKANSYLFESKDYDLLMSLPISPKVVISSKFASLLFINYATFAFAYIPTLIWYGYYVSPGALFYLMSVVIFLLGPLLVITVCSILSYLFGLILSKFKHRNLIQTFGLIVVFIIIMMFSFSFNQVSNIDPANELDALKNMADNLVKMAESIYYPSIWMADAILGNIISLLIIIGISIIPFVTFIYVVGHNFVKANARARVSYTDKNFKLREQNASSQFKTLLKREFKRYFSSSILVLNTIVGPIMGTIVVVMFLFGQETIIENVGNGALDKSILVAIIIAMITFMNGLISTTASSISLEGKQFWIIKSSPIKTEQVFMSKVMLNLAIAVPFTIVNAVLVYISLTPPIIDVLLVIIIPLLVNIIMGMMGLYINLLFPKFNWTAEVKVVKQSLSVFLTMLIGMLLAFGLIALFVFVVKFGIDIAYIIIIAALLVIIGLEILVLKTNGKKRYQKLKA